MQTLTKKQEEVIRSKSRYKVLNWGRRSGKTTEFAYEALGTALTIDNAKITYYAQTFGDARDIAWNIFLEVFGEAVIKKNETLLEIIVKNLKGGTSKIALKGWEGVVTAGKGRGTENDLILLDEVAFCRNFNEYWETVLDPTLLTSKGRAVFGSTPNGFNWFYDLCVKAQKTEDWYYNHATSYDNPHNSKEWIDKKKLEISEDKFHQEYLGDFRKQEGLVYKDFSRDRHITTRQPTKVVKTMVGVDWGWTNPAAVYRIREDGDRHYWIDMEFYKREQTTEAIIEAIKLRKPEMVYPDPAEPDRIEMCKRAGLNVREVSKDIEAGISSVQEILKQGRLHIHPDCVNLIWEFETYAYPFKKANQNEKELPIKENDHGMDICRYVLHNQEPADYFFNKNYQTTKLTRGI